MADRGFTIPAKEVEAALGRGVMRAVPIEPVHARGLERLLLDYARKALIDAIVMCAVRAAQRQVWVDGPGTLAPLCRIRGGIGG